MHVFYAVHDVTGLTNRQAQFHAEAPTVAVGANVLPAAPVSGKTTPLMFFPERDSQKTFIIQNITNL